ncbi:MAG: hypothetical protein SFZ23_12985 [Planctomycetota bacterium]|nr:hypothetical protein [Planctomycetota bacterium]
MPSQRTDRTRNLRPARTVFALLLAAGFVSGCGDAGADSQSVRKAANRFHAVSGGAPTDLYQRQHLDLLQQASSLTQPLVSRDGPIAGVASLIVSETQLSNALASEAQTGVLEQQALNTIRVARAALATYIESHAIAAATQSFDASGRERELAQQVTAVDAEMGQRRQAKATLETQVGELRAAAETRANAAKALYDQAAGLRVRMTEVTASQAATLASQAASLQREGDALARDASEIEAQASLLEPLAKEADLLAQQLVNQRESLQEAQAEVRQKVESNQRTADEARQRATAAGQDAATLVAGLATFRSGDVASAYQTTVTAYRSAISSAQKAQTSEPAQAKLAVGSLQQALGDLLWRRAAGIQAHAALLELMSQLEPALPDQASYASQRATLAEEAKTIAGEAAQAYEAAQSAFSTAPIRGTVKERLTQVGDRLGKLARIVRGESLDILTETSEGENADSQPAPEAGEAPTEEPAAAPSADAGGVPAELASLVQAMVDATKNADEAGMQALAVGPPELIEALLVQTRTHQKMVALDTLCEEKFQQSFVAALAASPIGQQAAQQGGDLSLLSAQRLRDLSPQEFEVTMLDAENATIQQRGSPLGIPVKMLEGVWKLDVSNLVQLQAAAPVTAALGSAADSVRTAIEAGQIQNVDMALQAFMMGIMSGMAPPPGGG